jgi:hypothetical protein
MRRTSILLFADPPNLSGQGEHACRVRGAADQANNNADQQRREIKNLMANLTLEGTKITRMDV